MCWQKKNIKGQKGGRRSRMGGVEKEEEFTSRGWGGICVSTTARSTRRRVRRRRRPGSEGRRRSRTGFHTRRRRRRVHVKDVNGICVSTLVPAYSRGRRRRRRRGRVGKGREGRCSTSFPVSSSCQKPISRNNHEGEALKLWLERSKTQRLKLRCYTEAPMVRLSQESLPFSIQSARTLAFSMELAGLPSFF